MLRPIPLRAVHLKIMICLIVRAGLPACLPAAPIINITIVVLFIGMCVFFVRESHSLSVHVKCTLIHKLLHCYEYTLFGKVL